MNRSGLIIYLIVLCYCSESLCTISPSDKKIKGKSSELVIKKGPQPDSVIDRNLIEDEPAARDIIAEHAGYYKDTGRRLFNGTILGYVTPVGSTDL